MEEVRVKEGEVKDAEERVRVKEEEVKEVRERVKDAEERVKEVEEEVKEVRERAKDAEERVKDAEERVKELEAEVEEVKEKVVEAEAKVVEAEAKMVEAEAVVPMVQKVEMEVEEGGRFAGAGADDDADAAAAAEADAAAAAEAEAETAAAVAEAAAAEAAAEAAAAVAVAEATAAEAEATAAEATTELVEEKKKNQKYVQSLQKQIVDLNSEISSLQEQLQVATDAVAGWEEAHRKSKAEALAFDMTDMEHALEEAKARVAVVEARNHALEAKLHGMERESHNASGTLPSFNESSIIIDAGRLEREVADLKQSKLEAQVTINDLRRQLDQVSTELAAAQTRAGENLPGQLEEAQRELASERAALETLRKASTEAETVSNARIGHLETALERLKTALAESDSAYLAKESECVVLAETLAQVEANADAALGQVEKEAQDRRAAMARVAALEGELEATQAGLSEAQDDLARVYDEMVPKATYAEKVAQVRLLSDERALLRGELEEMRISKSDLEYEVSVLQTKYAHLATLRSSSFSNTSISSTSMMDPSRSNYFTEALAMDEASLRTSHAHREALLQSTTPSGSGIALADDLHARRLAHGALSEQAAALLGHPHIRVLPGTPPRTTAPHEGGDDGGRDDGGDGEEGRDDGSDGGDGDETIMIGGLQDADPYGSSSSSGDSL